MLTEKDKKAIRRAIREFRYPVHDHLTERAALKLHIEACTEGGKIAIHRSGMDCDCTQYRSCRIVDAPKSVFAFVHGEEKHREWLDGPESMWIDKPSRSVEGHASADRALEAYEDGHPGTVYWGDL